MNLVTISNDLWLHTHTKRWLRYARQNTTCKLYLLLTTHEYQGVLHDPVVTGFDGVHYFPGDIGDRPWFNRIRMEATEIFGLNDCLYIDADADVYCDLSDIPGEADLRWVRSPVMHKNWPELCFKMGYGWPEWEANNGLLYMNRSFKDEYAEAEEKMKQFEAPDRIKGMQVFNVMLREVGNEELPMDWSRIWSHVEGVVDAKVLQFCNDRGQKKRMILEDLWEAIQ